MLLPGGDDLTLSYLDNPEDTVCEGFGFGLRGLDLGLRVWVAAWG
jgi:hypothetical protein